MMRHILFTLLILGGGVPAFGAAPSVNEFLAQGELAQGEEAFAGYLKSHPDDEQARFSLGTIQFLQAIEHLGQFFYQHGTTRLVRRLPLFRVQTSPRVDPDSMPTIYAKPVPVPTTYSDYRQMLKTLLADLQEAETTLAKIEGDVKLRIPFGRVRLDLNGDGAAGEKETLWRIYASVNQRFNEQTKEKGKIPEAMKDFPIAFDTGDVYWLRGYCHLLSALCEIQLAYDGRRWFDHCGHLLFPKAQVPYRFLTDNSKEGAWPYHLRDAIAAIHLLNFKLIKPQRMAAAREHLLAMTELSRQSWQSILAETDNDREWVPNADQKSVVGIPVSDEIIATWQHVLDDFEAVLRGEKLIPFWRDDRGVNLERVFTEPRDFDLILWIQGTAAVPYLEEGETISTESWVQTRRMFRGNFIGFAIWFN